MLITVAVTWDQLKDLIVTGNASQLVFYVKSLLADKITTVHIPAINSTFAISTLTQPTEADFLTQFSVAYPVNSIT